MGDTMKVYLAAAAVGLIFGAASGAAYDAKTASSRSLRIELAVQRLDNKVDQILARPSP